jgi:hypothetical protein
VNVLKKNSKEEEEEEEEKKTKLSGFNLSNEK